MALTRTFNVKITFTYPKILHVKAKCLFIVGQILFSLSWKRRVSVYQHQEEVIVDIREYSEGRTFQRSTKGVALTKPQWTKLREEMPNIEALVQQMGL